MAIELLVSPPSSGKTEACIQRVRSTLGETHLSKIWVAVPDRLQTTNFRRRLAGAGGAIGAYVGTFGDLYKSILERTGIYIPIASSPLLHRLMQEVVDDVAKQGRLAHYASLRTTPGFILALRDSFAELKRALVFPDQIIEYTREGTPAQQELAYLYFLYQSHLQNLAWADPEGLSWLAVEALEAHPAIATSIRLLVVDGFDSFTGAQRRALKLLGGQVGEMLITFPGVINSQRPAHRRFVKTIEILRQELSPQVTTLSNSPFLPPIILHLESQIFESSSTAIQAPLDVFLLETRSPADEAREALRWIKVRVVRNSLSLTDCAIFTPNPDVYHPLLRSIATEFGIPVHFTQSDALTASPAIATLMNLLSLPAQHFKTRALFNTLRSPYFEVPFDDQTIDVLETISRVARIVEGLDQWNETWERLKSSDIQEYPSDIDEERMLPGLPRGAKANALRNSLTDFFSKITPPNQSLSQTEWIAWLEDLLEDLHFYENADNEREKLACETLREALRALVLSETVAGTRRVEYAQFLSDLQGTLDGVGLSEPLLTGQPALLVGRMVEARGIRYKAVVLLGLSEGIFPEVERPDPFLDENLRESLGLEQRLQREQAGLFYQAVSRADQYLLITRPYLSEDGEDWEPSPFWKAAQDLFDESAIRKIRPDDYRSLVEAASSQELLFWAVRRKGLPERYDELQKRWQELRHARDVLKARREKVAQGAYEGAAAEIAPLLSARYSSEQIWSASRLETYSTCPYMFYIKVALGLEPNAQPELGLDPSQTGSMLHKILEEVYRTAANPADLESVVSNLPQVAGQVFATAPEQHGFRASPLWDIEQTQFLDALELTIRALAEEGKEWTPFAYEQAFGIQGKPPLLIDLGEEILRLHGVIDRLDRTAEGNIRIVDYKTGSSHLAQGDLKDGRRLQLPLYALAVRDALGLGEPVDGMYWKILAAESGSLKLARFKTDDAQGVDAAIQVAKEHLKRIISGIRLAEFPPAPPKGGCPSYCPAVLWCWRYEPGW